MITDGIFLVSPETPLAEFNTLSASEHVAVDSTSIDDYAAFFLKSFLLSSDTRCLSSWRPTLPNTGELPTGLCAEPRPFTVSRQGARFVVDTIVVDRTGRWTEAHRFSIGGDGQVSSLR